MLNNLKAMTTENIHTTRAQILLSLSLLFLPFIILYWLAPAFSDLTIGNDYGTFPIQHQMELAYSFEHSSFPLYAPGFAGGQSAATLTLGQAYHPISHIARLLPGYWEGDALKINTILRLISLGFCHLLVFYLLRRLGLSITASLILSFITIYNLRMLDHFRYGASLENYTAFIGLCSFITLRYLSPSSWLINIGIVASAYLLTVGGHPQMFYLGFLGAAVVTLTSPFFVMALNPKLEFERDTLLRYWLNVLAFVFAGALLASPYILSFYFEFVASNTARAANGYQWAASYQDSWGGALRNLYAPLKADVHGSFGGSSLIILIISLPIILIYRKRPPLVITISIALTIIFFLICIGDATPLHYGAWKFIPFADKFRVPGRFSLWLVFPILFVLAWLFKSSSSYSIKIGSKVSLSPLTLTACISLILLIAFYLGFDNLLPASSYYTPARILRIPNTTHNNLFYIGILTLIICAIYGLLAEKQSKASGLVGLLLVLCVFAQVTLALRNGTWIITDKPQKTLAEMHQEKQKDFKLYAVPGFGLTTGAVDAQLKHSILEPKIARAYRNVITVKNEEDMWSYLSTYRTPVDAIVLTDEPLDLTGTTDSPPISIKLVEAGFNQVIFEVITNEQSFVSSNMPYRSNWIASIDGKPVKVYQANGIETGVFVPQGAHQVTFTYDSPKTVYGVIVAASTLLFLLLYIAWKLKGRKRLLMLTLAITFPTTMFYIWYMSLYHGTPIETSYEWTSADLPDKNNLAYGKNTLPSSLYSTQMPYYYYSGLAVDGDTTGAPFATARTRRPSWTVDLGEISKVEKVKIHGIKQHSLPITVYVSTNQEKYQAIIQIKNLSEILEFDLNGMELQFLAIRSDRHTILSFSEVEVIGTQLKVITE